MINVLGQSRYFPTTWRGSLADGLELRPLKASDRPRVRAVVDAWWGRPMGELLPRPFFSEFSGTSFVVEREDELIAFLVGFLSQANHDDAYIHAVAVAPAWRGRGLARLLYARFADVAERHGRSRVRAITSPVNAASIAFHRQLGFAVAMPSDADGDNGRVEFAVELPEPTSLTLDSVSPYQAAAALRTPLSGTQVLLEPLARRHAEHLAVAAAASDWSLMQTDDSSPLGFAAWLELMLATSGNGDADDPRAAFAVVRRDSGRAVGSTSFHSIYPAHRRIEIGRTWYARDQWRSGINVEAKLLMLARAFALGFRRVEFKTDALNVRSRRALEALPAQFEGVFRKHMLVRDDERRDSAYYSVIDDDWPDVRANLEGRLKKHRRQRDDQQEGEIDQIGTR